MQSQPVAYRGSFDRLADARRVIKVAASLSRLPVLPADERLELAKIKIAAELVIAEAVDDLIETLDLIRGDPDFEDDDPAESDGTELDMAWPEWHGRGRHKEACMRHFGHILSEDAEDDTEDCSGFEDEPLFGSGMKMLNALFGDGPGGGALLDPDNENF